MRVLLIASFFFLSFTELYAQNQSIEDQLSEIELASSKITEDLSDLARQLTAIEGEKKRLDADLHKLKNREQAAQLELQKSSQALELAKEELAQAKKDHARLIHASSDRMRALYIQLRSQESIIESLNDSSLKWHQVSFYTAKIRQHDLQLIKSLKASFSNLQLESERLQKLVQDHDNIKNKIRIERNKIEQLAGSKRKLLNDTQKEQSSYQKRLTELQAQSLRLETIMVSLTEGGAAETYYGKQRPASEIVVEKKLSFVGAGLKPFRGQLLKPAVEARVIDPKVLGPGLIQSKGVYFQTRLDSDVRAVAAGQVIFSGNLTGYGQTIILDHGQRSYSVYSRLSSLSAKKGVVLQSGQELGRPEKAPFGGQGIFYFEVREGSKTVKPLSYLVK